MQSYTDKNYEETSSPSQNRQHCCLRKPVWDFLIENCCWRGTVRRISCLVWSEWGGEDMMAWKSSNISVQHTGGAYTGISVGAGMLRIKRSRFGEVLHMKEVLSYNKAETAYFVQKKHTVDQRARFFGMQKTAQIRSSRMWEYFFGICATDTCRFCSSSGLYEWACGRW